MENQQGLKPVPRTWCDDVLDQLEPQILAMHEKGKAVFASGNGVKIRAFMVELKTMIEDAKALDNLNVMVGHAYVKARVEAADAEAKPELKAVEGPATP